MCLSAREMEVVQQAILYRALTEAGIKLWDTDPLGNKLFDQDNKFYASIASHNCIITIEFEDPR